MPTTLITQVSGIGLGCMAQSLAEHVPSIDRLVGVRRIYDKTLDLKFPERCRFEVHEGEIPPSALGDDRKFIYIESSYGLSRLMVRALRRIYVPMWEQGSTLDEARNANNIVCVTKYTTQYIAEQPLPWKQCVSMYLPWPVDTSVRPRRVSRVKTILHNAGSLGGNLRKGTDAAIRIFQQSGVARDGVRLVIHSWLQPPPTLAAMMAEAPDGITWTGAFLKRAEDIYDEYTPDLLLFPSKIEGHALVVLEAMARGIPALATDSAPINEYDWDVGFRIPVFCYEKAPLNGPYAIVDVEAGAERLRQLCARNLAGKSTEVRELVEREYSWKALGEQWEALCA